MRKSVQLSFLSSTAFLLMFTILLHLVHAHGRETHPPKQNDSAVTYMNTIRPILEKNCMKCHGPDSPEHMVFMKDLTAFKKKLKGPRMDTYPHMVSFVVWPDTGALMRALDDGTDSEKGKPGNMYKHLGKSPEERRQNLDLFKKWVGNWTLKEWADITKDEINGMLLAY